MTGQNLVLGGLIAILMGVILIMVGTFLQTPKSKTEGGFVLFIGPFPIVGATSRNMLYAVIALSVLAAVVFLLMNKKIF